MVRKGTSAELMEFAKKLDLSEDLVEELEDIVYSMAWHLTNKAFVAGMIHGKNEPIMWEEEAYKERMTSIIVGHLDDKS